MHRPRVGLLFSYEWDRIEFGRLASHYAFDQAGFDLFSFPSNTRLIGFDLQRFADQQARRGRQRGWQGVLSHREPFGTLAAALVAGRLGLPGASPQAILSAQHKLYARQVLQRVAPEANLPFAGLDARYGDPMPAQLPGGLHYPVFVKPVKAAFSVLAREVADQPQLQAHTRFGWRELWVIRHLMEPFDRICRQYLPEAGTCHRLMIEESVRLDVAQFNLDGWVQEGQVHALGVVDAITYPGTQAFMRWQYPSQLDAGVQARALDVARRFLSAIDYRQGMFNLEFFYDARHDRLSVIECNPRLASQFGDLYRRVLGFDAHAASLALACGEDPAHLPRMAPTARVAASQVYRAFSPHTVPAQPRRAALAAWRQQFPDGLLFQFPKQGHSLMRDFKWTGNTCYGIVHLGAADWHALRLRTEQASRLLGWPAPYRDLNDPPLETDAPMPTAPPLMEIT